MKKLFILLSFVLIIFVGCQKETPIIEPEVTKSSVTFPFDSRDNGKFISIYRNNSADSIPITFIMTRQREVIEDSKKLDFCPDILNIRKGIELENWAIVNWNYPIIPEINVENQNDHPNLISYSLPIGTYIAFLMDADGCTKDQYSVFDIKTDKGIEILD